MAAIAKSYKVGLAEGCAELPDRQRCGAGLLKDTLLRTLQVADVAASAHSSVHAKDNKGQ